MSVKIYNGFWFSGDIYDFLETADEFRPFVKQASKEHLAAFLAGWKDRTAGYREWLDLRERVRKTGFRNIAVDTDFSITLLPVPQAELMVERAKRGSEDACGNSAFGGVPWTGVQEVWLGITFTEQAAWHEAWLRQDGVEDFHYQNQSDRPAELSEAAWSERRWLWDKVLLQKRRGAGIPSMHGLSIDLHDPLEPAFTG